MDAVPLQTMASKVALGVSVQPAEQGKRESGGLSERLLCTKPRMGAVDLGQRRDG